MSQVLSSAWVWRLPVIATALATSPAWAQGIGSPAIVVPVWLDFRIALPPLWPLIWFALAVVTWAILAQGAYRVSLRSYVLQGVHPAKVANTLLLMSLGLIAMSGYVLLEGIGSGYFFALFALLGFVTLGLTIMQSILLVWGIALMAFLSAIALLGIFEIL